MTGLPLRALVYYDIATNRRIFNPSGSIGYCDHLTFNDDITRPQPIINVQISCKNVEAMTDMVN